MFDGKLHSPHEIIRMEACGVGGDADAGADDDDNGGQIGNYLAKYKTLRVSGERVVIDGTCAIGCI
jgi:hypothetical protein